MGNVTKINRTEYTVKWKEWIPAPDTLNFMLTLEDSAGHRIYADVPYDMYMVTIPGDIVLCTSTGDGSARFELKGRN